MVGVRALCGCFVFLLVAVMLLGELDFVTEHIGEPPARRVVDSVLLRSIIGSAWVDRPEQQLLTLRPPDRVRTNVQQEYPPSNTTILAFVNSGYWPWVEHLLNNVAALGLSQHLVLSEIQWTTEYHYFGWHWAFLPVIMYAYFLRMF